MNQNKSLKRSPGMPDLSAMTNNPKETPKANAPTTNRLGGGLGKTGGQIQFGVQKKTEKHVDPVLQRLYRIRDAYKKPVASAGSAYAMGKTQSQDSYKFSSIVYNVSAGGAATRAQGMNQQDWDKECAKAKLYPVVNIDSMTPFLLCGFDKLAERTKLQKEFVEKMANKLDSMKLDIQRIRERYDSDFKRYVQKISENNQKISEKLMEVLKKEEVKNSLDIAFSPEEHELFDKLQSLENEISKPNKFKSALNALNLKAIMIRESTPYYPEIKITNQIDEAEAIIQSNHEAISSLVNIISQTQKNTEALEKTYQDKIQTYIDSFNSYE